MKASLRVLPLSILLLAGVNVASAATYYVRTVGSDTVCNGTAPDAPGVGTTPNCAFRSLYRANQDAVCGDTIDVGAGEFFETTKTVIGDDCSSGSPLTIQGAGVGQTWIFGTMVRATSCSESGTNSYVCTPPANFDLDAVNDEKYLVMQSNARDVYITDGSFTQHYMNGLVRLSWDTTGAASVDAHPGSVWYDSTNDLLYIHGWNGRDPLAKWYVPTASDPEYADGADGPIYVNDASYIVLQDFSFVWSSGNAGIGVSNGSNVTIRDVETWGSYVQFSGHTGGLVERVKGGNGYGRGNNNYVVEWANGSNTTGFAMSGGSNGFIVRDVESFSSREGCSFAGAYNGTIDGLRCYNHHNHILKLQDNCRDLTFNDVVTYNGQESIFIECCHNITVTNFASNLGGIIQGRPDSPNCTAMYGVATTNIDFFNSSMCGITYANLGAEDTWAAGGHDLQGNAFVDSTYSAGDCARNGTSTGMIKAGALPLTTLAGINTSNPGTCSNCVLSNNVADRSFNLWANDDRFETTTTIDLRPTENSLGLDNGIAGKSDSKDVLGVTRFDTPDSGAYEGAAGSVPECDDGIDNDGDGSIDYPDDSGCSAAADTSEALCGDGFLDAGEVCDGANLGGQSCVSRGFDSGSLACAVTCDAFDESGCVNNPERSILRGVTIKGLRIE